MCQRKQKAKDQQSAAALCVFEHVSPPISSLLLIA